MWWQLLSSKWMSEVCWQAKKLFNQEINKRQFLIDHTVSTPPLRITSSLIETSKSATSRVSSPAQFGRFLHSQNLPTTYNSNSAWTHDNTFLCKTLLFEFSMSDIPLNPWELILANTNSFFQVCNFVFMYNIIHFLHILLSAWYKKVPRNVQTYIDLIATKHLQKSFWFNLA